MGFPPDIQADLTLLKFDLDMSSPVPEAIAENNHSVKYDVYLKGLSTWLSQEY